MIDWIQNAFLIRALIAGVLVGALASYYGTFIVQRRLSFLGSGLAHAAFGGIALGLLLQRDPLFVAIPFTILVAVAINWVRSKTILAADTAIGVFFAVSVALGVIFLSMREGTTYVAFSYLFGSILAISIADIWIIVLIFLIGLSTLPRLWGNWAFATFDEESARADDHSVSRDDYVLNVLLAITIVAAIKMVGILLIAAFLVIPAASSRLLSPTFFWMTVVSVLLGATSAFVGMVGSYELDLPSGATIILCQAIIFGFALMWSRWRAEPI